MKGLAFIWDWEIVPSQAITWEDGLARAIQILGEKYDVRVYTIGKMTYDFPHPYFNIRVCTNESHMSDLKDFSPDALLFWGDTTRPNAEPASKLGIPMALCFAGGETNGGTAQYFQYIFVESEVYKPGFMKRGIPVSTAFGTNTELFRPVKDQSKLFDTIFPATFAIWKRHELYAEATKGLCSLACGYMYDTHEQECWQVCLDNGVTILPHVSAQTLRYLYAASKVCVIPSRSDGGSQRTVLEAMAMNIPLVVTDSDKFDYTEGRSYVAEPNVVDLGVRIDEALASYSECNTRDYVLQNWSEYNYADALEKGLLSI